MLLLLLMVGAVAGYDRSVNYWEAFAPGKLLQRLDELTLTDGQPVDVVAKTEQQLPPNKQAQAKLDEDADEGDELGEGDVDVEIDAEADEVEHDDADVEEADSAEAHSGEDYERNYEQFVRQYFDRVPDGNDDEDDDNEEHVEQLEDDSSSIETQAEASNVQRQQKPMDQHKRQHCRRVKRQGQLCKICREPSNNEVSETCSYSHEAEPEKYAYGRGSQYKRYRDQSSPREEKEQRRSERHTTVVQPADDNSSSSLCVRRLQGKSICYECKDSGGKRISRCYDAAIKMNKHSKRSSKKPRNSKQSEQEQRIYKRTISYSYAQDSSLDDQDNNKEFNSITTQSTPIQSAHSPPSPSTGRRFTKFLRRRTAIPRIAA
ncbi:uncharacterized protein DDB_G0283697 [Drosophila innubila]|uniref:uncharacterized protein DDB_G0283697 n=1 Tax=Drosophila innubila TaxID=198719 RepID=UPI00148BE0B0|nr:uncharacterized protein DDB_G0283697 [Drosophila innubila]